jgi:hypothetical protein
MTKDLANLAASVARSFSKVPRDKVNHFELSYDPHDSKITHPANYDSIYPDGISPFTAYSFLKEHFGTPQWRIRNNAEYEKIQWMYFLKARTSYLEIYDWKLISWHVRVSYEKVANAGKKDVERLLSQIREYARLKGTIPQSDLRYEMIANVYLQNYTRAGHILGTNNGELDPEAVTNWAAALFYAFSVDALLNIIYEIYITPEIRNNKELVQQIERMSPKEKWCLAPRLCTCFSKPLTNDSLAYQKLSETWNLRIQGAHGKITEQMRLYFMRKDGLGFPTTKKYSEYLTWYDFDAYPDAEATKADVDAIVAELLRAMKPQLRKTFERKLRQTDITFDRVKQRLAGPQHDFWA